MMTTKEQERKALDKIREILAGLGDDSYVGTAFEGCIDDAETNIENDWALSMNGRWQDAEQKVEHLQAEIDVINRNNDALRERLDRAEEKAEYWHEKARDAKEDLANEQIEKALNDGEIARLNDANEALQEEIVHLKAKLYDLMIAVA